jgi:hypothetical protein
VLVGEGAKGVRTLIPLGPHRLIARNNCGVTRVGTVPSFCEVMVENKQPDGPPMTLGTMRRRGVRHLHVLCLNPLCKHQVVLNVDQYDDCVLVQSFPSRMICGRCRFVGADVRPWKEQPPQPSLTAKVFR